MNKMPGDSMLLRKMVVVLMVLGMVIVVLPTILFADLGQTYVLGNNLGLVIHEASGTVVSDNLAPGDIVRSTMTLENNGTGPFEVYFKTNIKQGSEASPRGGVLAERLLVEIKMGDNTLVSQMPFREATQLTQVLIAQMAVRSKVVLDFIVSFPESANNDYQGATFQAFWTFVTVGGNQTTTEVNESTIPQSSAEPMNQPATAEATVSQVNLANDNLETVNNVDEEEILLGNRIDSGLCGCLVAQEAVNCWV